MKQLLRLIDTCRNYGLVVSSPADDGGVKLSPVHPEVWQKVEKCQPFVFSAGPVIRQDLKDPSMYEAENAKIDDAPFEVFSIEYEDGPIAKNSFDVYCVVCMEITPTFFAFLTLIESLDSTLHVYTSLCEGQIVRDILKRLSSERLGMQSVRQNIKIGTGKNKRVHRLRRIIHVRPKHRFDKHTQSVHHDIDWTYRFNVRGHWRKIDGLGKDREGQYCVSGFTWVQDYVKGSEDLPLVNKVRLVNEPKDTTNENSSPS